MRFARRRRQPRSSEPATSEKISTSSRTLSPSNERTDQSKKITAEQRTQCRIGARSCQLLHDQSRINPGGIAGAVHRGHIEVGVGVLRFAGPIRAGFDADVIEK